MEVTQETPVRVSATGWWRTNRLALVALGLLLPAATMTFAGDAVLHALTPPPVVALGATAELAGYEVGPVTIEDVTGDASSTPGDVVAVVIPLRPIASSGTGCQALRLGTAESGPRWNTTVVSVPWEFDEFTTFCPANGESATIKQTYVVPSGTSGPFVVEVQDSVDGDIVLFTADR